METQHECTTTASDGIQLLADCGDATGSSGVVSVVIGVVVLVAVGVAIWWLVKRRA